MGDLMAQKVNPAFQFYNAVSPRYIEPLFLQLQYGQSYSTTQLVNLLRASGLHVEGNSIVHYNLIAWSFAKLGQTEKSKIGTIRGNLFKLTELGRQLIDTYST